MQCLSIKCRRQDCTNSLVSYSTSLINSIFNSVFGRSLLSKPVKKLALKIHMDWKLLKETITAKFQKGIKRNRSLLTFHSRGGLHLSRRTIADNSVAVSSCQRPTWWRDPADLLRGSLQGTHDRAFGRLMWLDTRRSCVDGLGATHIDRVGALASRSARFWKIYNHRYNPKSSRAGAP